MAHITEVLIEGLLGREDSLRFKLNRGINIFFGENGCGKTTLLKVLDAALSMDSTAMEALPVAKATVDIFSINENKVIRHSWERRSDEAVRRSTAKQPEMVAQDFEYLETSEGRILLGRSGPKNLWKLSPAKRKKAAGTKWAHTFLPTTRLYFGNSVSGRSTANRSQLSEKELDQAFSDSMNREWLRFYSRTLNEVRSIQEVGLRAVLRYVLNPEKEETEHFSHDADPVYDRVANFLARQQPYERITLGSKSTFRKRYERDPHLRKIVGNLDEVERSIEQTMVPVKRFLETISHLFSRGKKLEISDNELQILLADGRILPIAQLSSGEKHLIKILLSSMTSGPNSILIDEPELSMHIDWQRVFPQTILSLNPECQLILASHSPEVMAEVPDECIFKL